MIRSSLKDFYDNINRYIEERENKSFLCIYEQTEINYGIDEDCDLEWCKEHSIPTYNIGRCAGCCVNATGNINVADIRINAGYWVERKFSDEFKQFLLDKGLNAEDVGNDILVDGYKVASSAGMNLAPDYKVQYTCIQISINQDLEVIEHACKKPMTKTPKGLSKWGITTEEVAEWCENFFDNLN